MAEKTDTHETQGETLTEQRKQELLDAARAQAEATPVSTEKIGADMAPAPTLDAVGAVTEKPVAVAPAAGYVEGKVTGEGIEGFQTPVYGPYTDYTIVPTMWGEFGVPKGEVLWFEAKAKFSPKSGEFIQAHLPRHAKPKDAPANIKELLGVGV